MVGLYFFKVKTVVTTLQGASFIHFNLKTKSTHMTPAENRNTKVKYKYSKYLKNCT